MKSGRTLQIVIVGVAVLSLLGVFYFYQQSKTEFVWHETFDPDGKEPYDLHVIRELLQADLTTGNFVRIADSLAQRLPDRTDRPANYVFVGGGMLMDTAAVERIFRFVEQGNHALISSKSLPLDILEGTVAGNCWEEWWTDYWSIADTLGTLRLEAQRVDSLNCQFYRAEEVRPYNWQYYPGFLQCYRPDTMHLLGTVNEEFINFIRIQYGAGALLLHTTPLAFTNFQLLDTAGVTYAASVFAHLPIGDVYWDDASRVDERVARARNQYAEANPRRGLSDESPMQYILAQPALAWAWYTLVGLGLLYLIFRAKRRQRPIPVLEANENTSLQFIQNIGRLTFLRGNHRKLALQKMKLFQAEVKHRYQLSSTSGDPEFQKRLARRAEVNPAIIERIYQLHQNIASSNFTSENTLVDFHRSLETFYQKMR